MREKIGGRAGWKEEWGEGEKRGQGWMHWRSGVRERKGDWSRGIGE